MNQDVWRDAYGDTVELTLTPYPGTDTVTISTTGGDDVVIHTTRPITFVEKTTRPRSQGLLRRLLGRLLGRRR